MSNASIRRLIGGLGTALILLICAVVIGAHFLTGRNLQHIDVSAYTNVKNDGANGYTAELDVDRLIAEERLHNPTETEKTQYPEIEALRGLSVRVSQKGDLYELETVTTGEDPTALLKQHGIRLINTKWTMRADQMKTAAGQEPAPEQEKTKELSYPQFVRTSRAEDGEYTAALDRKALFAAAGIDPAADPETNAGARALRSLDVACKKTDDGYSMQAISTLTTVMEDLATAELRIMDTQWTWTETEMEAHAGTVEPLEPPATQAPETPAPGTDAPETDAPETDAPETPAPATPTETAPATTAPATPQRNADAIDSLYGFDQTELRKAIRSAKEEYYGASLDGSEVKYNYFAVGGESAEHGNVFRLVYTITTSKGTEYLVADVYDLERETGYTIKDVHLRVAKDRSDAKSTADLKDYTVHTLTGGSMVFPENKDKNPYDKDGLVMAKSISESVTYDELWDIPATSEKTLLDLLGYARNEMFARGGEKFSDTSNYRKFYSKYSWYKPTGKITVDQLAKKYPSTRGNITTIKFLEKLIKEG